jgi:hypothetical protein
MHSQQIRKFDMLRRVQQFLDGSAGALSVVNATAARKELDGIVQAMAANEVAQATSTLNAKRQTATLEELRRALYKDHMRPVATIAAAQLRAVPGYKALVLPPVRVKDAVLVQAAVAMAEAAREHAEVFVDNGCPADFADALVAAAAAVRQVIDARAKHIGGKAEARDGLKASADRAQAVVRLLDARVKTLLKDDPQALAGWRSAKRIGKGRVVTPMPTSGSSAEVKAA